jgi:hypothetical protein
MYTRVLERYVQKIPVFETGAVSRPSAIMLVAETFRDACRARPLARRFRSFLLPEGVHRMATIRQLEAFETFCLVSSAKGVVKVKRLGQK